VTSRRICIGSVERDMCIDVKLIGKGEKRLAVLYSSTCLDVAISRIVREYKSFSKFRVAFISLTNVLSKFREASTVIHDAKPVRKGFLDVLRSKIMELAEEYGSAILIDCFRDTIPLGVAYSDDVNIAGIEALCIHPEYMPTLLAELSQKGMEVAWVWLPCGTDFSINELENAVRTIKEMILGSGDSRPEVFKDCEFIESPASGIFVPAKSVREHVVEGECIGHVNEAEVIAPCDGFLAFISRGREVVFREVLAVILRKRGL